MSAVPNQRAALRHDKARAGTLAWSLVAATIVTFAGVVATPNAALAAAPTFTSPCFTSVNKSEPLGVYTVPASGVSSVRLVLHGQRGEDRGLSKGGVGSRLVAELAVTPGQALVLGTLSGASGGAGAPKVNDALLAGDSGGRGGAAQFVSTLGADGCQHVLALAGGGGGAGAGGGGGNAEAGTAATGGANGGNNNQSDAGGGGGATATSGGSGGAAGSSTFGYCSDGNAGSWGGLWSNGRGGDAAGTGSVNPCYNPRDGGGGGGAGYHYGGGGGSPYALGAAAGGGGGSTYVDPSVQKISLAASNAFPTPIAAPVYDTATAIGSTPNPSYAGKTVTINTHTTVLGTGQPVRLGEVTIRNGSTVLATLPLDANGRTTMTTTDLPVGDGALSATFISVEDPSIAYRASATAGSIARKVHPCAPAPTIVNQPATTAATTGTTNTLRATVSVSPLFEGIPTMKWQTSEDNGSTWADAVGTSTVSTSGMPEGTAATTFAYPVSGGPRVLKYRAIAATCGGSTTSNAASLTVRAIDFDLTGLTKTFGAAPFDVSGYAARSNVPVGFSSKTPATCSVDDTDPSGEIAPSVVTVLAAGTCTLAANEFGDPGFTPAPEVQRSFTTAKKPLTVTAVANPLTQPQGTTSTPTIACNAPGFVGTDTHVTAPIGVWGIYDGRRDGDGNTSGRFIANNTTNLGTVPEGTSYITHCSGGNPGSNYAISKYVDGTFKITAPVVATDTTAPVVTVPAAMTREASSASGAAVTFEATAQDAVNGATTVTCNPASGSTFALGATTVTCISTDAAGNTGTASFTVTVLDTVAPVVTVPADTSVEATSADGADFSFEATAQDAVNGATTVTCNRTSGSTFALGESKVTCSSADQAGNEGENSFTVTVVDTRSPVVSVPEDIVAEATSAAGAVATFTASATDAVDGPSVATCAPASGTTYAISTTTVTCSVTDVAGNIGTATFTVAVTDTTDPDTALNSALPGDPTKQTGANFDFSGTDLVGVASFECKLDSATFAPCESPLSYSGLAQGSHTFEVRARDAAGNVDKAPASATWTVDTTAPVVAVANVTVDATSPAGATVPFTATATDTNPANPVVACAPAAGSTFAIGTTTVTCSATDAAGNIGTATFTVTVTTASTQLTNLQAKVQSVQADPTTRKNLQRILYTAQEAVDKGDTLAACDKLTSFVSQVTALSGKKIATPIANGLLIDARRIMAVLRCS